MSNALDTQTEHTSFLLPGIVVLNYNYFPDSVYSASKVGATAFAMSAVQVLKDVHAFCGIILYKRQEDLEWPSITMELRNSVLCATVSFHFGMPDGRLLKRVKDAGLLVTSSATSAEEARWLEDHGCDVVIAQGNEAGGHRGMFLNDDIARQAGTMALVPQVVDAVKVPVIAAGGIGDGRGIVAALALGAAGVQIGTAFLLTPEAKTSALHRTALKQAHDNSTTLTNVFTGRPARGIVNRYVREVGPMSPHAPQFPLAAGASQPMRAAGEAKGSADFTPLWSGQAPTFAREMPTADLIEALVKETEAVMTRLG